MFPKTNPLLIMAFIATTIFPQSSAGFIFDSPKAIEFKTDFYNSTTCNTSSVVPYRTNSFKNVCLKGAESCCAKDLTFFAFLPDSKFNTCYTQTFGSTNISYIYSCGPTDFEGVNNVMTDFAILGVALLFLFVIMFVFFMIRLCFIGCRKNQYNQI